MDLHRTGPDSAPHLENMMRALLTLAIFATVSACDAPPPDATPDEDNGPVTVSIQDDGTVLLDDVEMTTAELGEALEEIEATRVVSVEVEPEVTYRTVSAVQKALVEAGMKRVVVQTELE